MSIVNAKLFSIWLKEEKYLKKYLAVKAYVYNVVDMKKYTEEQSNEIDGKIKNFVINVTKKWKDCCRKKSLFEKKFKDWLNEPSAIVEEKTCTNVGRQMKKFSDCSKKTQTQKVSHLINDNPCSELLVATQCSLYKAGKRCASQVIAMLDSDGNASKTKKKIESDVQLPMKYTPEEALALYIDGDYSKHSYQLMQRGAKVRRANIYPSYDALQLVKKHCYPSEVLVADDFAEVTVQSMVDHTIARIIQAHSDKFEDLNNNKNEKLVAIYKWGCDGSSGHSTYRQSFIEPEKSMADEHMFIVCIVPLQVQVGSRIVWKNTRPSSTRFCRPIKIMCKKETADVVRVEIENVQKQISLITPTILHKHQVYHEFHLTMIDGKTFTTIAESTSQTCGICKCTPKFMNDLSYIKKIVVSEHLYDYGLSTLHAWIRFFECIIHISYRLIIKKWQVRGFDKDIVNKRKQHIQNEFKEKMSLLVDIPAAGTGNTNNGNTARRFFLQPTLASEITGVSEEIIKRFGVILRCMACGYAINVDAFRQYTYETAKIFVCEYPWFYMPSSIHKVLMHGADIINSFALPIGMMSEEALEASNKTIRNFRLNHTRKNSRQHTMKDLLHSLLFSSDPLVSNLSKRNSICCAKNLKLDREAKSLLLDYDIQSLPNSDTSDSE